MIDSLSEVPLLGGTRSAPTERTFIVGGLVGERILVPLVDPSVPVLTDQIGVATALARATGASLRVTTPVTVAGHPPMEYREGITAEAERELLEWAVEETDTLTSGLRDSFLSTRRIVNGVHRRIADQEIDTLILPSTSDDGLLGRTVTDRLVSSAECDVIVVNGEPGYDEAASILLPIAGGPHSGLAADTAAQIAESSNAWIDVLHVVDEGASDRQRALAEEYVEATHRRIARPETTTTWILEAGDVAEAIIEQSQYYGLTVVGAPTVGRLHRFVYGSTNRSIRSNAESVVLSTRNGGDTRALLDR